MKTKTRNRLILLGFLWGLLLAVVPAAAMARPFQLSGFLAVALVCAVLSGIVGTLAAGKRASRVKSGKRRKVLAGLGTGFFQGLVGGVVAAFLIWALMSLTLSGFSLAGPVDVSVLMSPRVFMGSFFVALSVFLYAVVGGILLGPAFGTLVNRCVRFEERT